MNLWRLAESFGGGDHLLDVLESGNSPKVFYLSFQGPADFASWVSVWTHEILRLLIICPSHILFTYLDKKTSGPFVGP